MNTLADLPRLKWAIASLLLSLIAAGAALWYLGGQLDQAQQVQARAERAYQGSHAKYVGARRDEGLIRQTIDHFREIEQAGMVGDETRLDWVERLRSARSSARLPRLDFELRPRRRLPGQADGQQYLLTTSSMTIRGDLPHEGRLLNLLDELAAERSALMRVRSCAIERATASQPAALNVQCELDWITISSASAQDTAR